MPQAGTLDVGKARLSAGFVFAAPPVAKIQQKFVKSAAIPMKLKTLLDVGNELDI